jgi:hypothetical protein
VTEGLHCAQTRNACLPAGFKQGVLFRHLSYHDIDPEAGIQASFHYMTSNPGVKSRVAAVNSLLKSTSGENRLFIDARCKHLLKDLERVVWKRGTALIEKDKDPELTHISDALGYLVETEAGIRTQGGFMPDRIV